MNKPKPSPARGKVAAAKELSAWEKENLTLERAMFQDTINVRWREIRAITGCVDDNMNVIEGACTLYLEGQLGFQVNHTREEVVAMIQERMVATPPWSVDWGRAVLTGGDK